MERFEQDGNEPDLLPLYCRHFLELASLMFGWHFKNTESSNLYAIQALSLFVHVLDSMTVALSLLAQWAHRALDIVKAQDTASRQAET